MWITRSVQFSRSVESDPLWPHGLQHTRFPCPSPSPGAYSNSCPFSQWCHPTISSSELQSPEELVNLQIWIPWVSEGPKSRSFQQAPSEATAEGLWTTQGSARPQPWGGGRGGVGSQQSVLSTSAPLQTWNDALYQVWFSMAAPHLNSIPLYPVIAQEIYIIQNNTSLSS